MGQFATAGDDLEGDDMEGEDDAVVGYVMGDGEVVGARRHGRGHRGGRVLKLPARPGWRAPGRMAAPGVPSPGEGQELMPLTGDSAGGVFSLANAGAIITFSARPQRPFQCQRLIAIVTRFPDPVAGLPLQRILCDGQFIGTSLMQIVRGAFDIEVFPVTAFGVRQSLVPAEPGIAVELPCRAFGPAFVGVQAIAVTVAYLGLSIQ